MPERRVKKISRRSSGTFSAANSRRLRPEVGRNRFTSTILSNFAESASSSATLKSEIFAAKIECVEIVLMPRQFGKQCIDS